MLVEDAPEAARPALHAAIAQAAPELPVTLEVRERPARAARAAATPLDFANVRSAYEDGDLEGCLAALPDAAAIDAMLADGDTATASRALFWRMACLRALGRLDEALAVAREHAARGLPIPADAGAANATAETLLRDAHRDASAAARASITVTSTPAGAEIAIDGAPTGTTTPATLAVAPGAHLVRALLPTYAARATTVRAESGTTAAVTLELAPLEPEAAVAALDLTLDAGAPADGDVPLALLATALRARSLVLVTRGDDAARAALITTADDGRHVVRAERVGEHATDLSGLLRDVLVRGRLALPSTPFYELPELWIAVACAVAIGVGVTLGVTLQPPPHTRVVIE
jgi:hypothetical protein